jgi:asparagine synthase (glutamine-hydrolysing)
VLSYNGEIYNHVELRRELERAGRAPVWRGHSDTETLLAAVVAWGLGAALKQALGMFAFALWDRQDRTLWLTRDRMGEKPLYYGLLGTGRDVSFVFASELKAFNAHPDFKPRIDFNALDRYLRLGVVPAPYSIYQGILKLEPGCVLRLTGTTRLDTLPEVVRWWDLEQVAEEGLDKSFTNESEAIDHLEAELSNAIQRQMIADVPLGAFLSGGIDSSTIVALMQRQSDRPVQTFTVGFSEAAFNEAPLAAAVARHLGTDHAELYVTPDQARDVIPLLPQIYCEPFADSSQIPTFLISQAARSRVTVALTGDGGDELFGGYNRYFQPLRVWQALSLIAPTLRRGAGRLFEGVSAAGLLDYLFSAAAREGIPRLGARLRHVHDLVGLYGSLVAEWHGQATPLLSTWLERAINESVDLRPSDRIREPEHRMMLWDGLGYLPDDILTKVDRASMAVSLETRVPMLDPNVVRSAWRLPLYMKVRNGRGKWALRQVLKRYVPDRLIERPKVGFGIPVGQWLRGPLRDWAAELLDVGRIRTDGYLDPVQVQILWKEHQSRKRDWTVRLWSILMFQAWLAEQASSLSAGAIVR